MNQAHTGKDKLYFRLVIQGLGFNPKGFAFWKFVHRQSQRVRVRVFGRGAAALYDVPETEDWMPLFAHDLKKGRFFPHGGSPLDAERLEVVRRVGVALREPDLKPALLALNRRVPHRFTAIYALDAGVMRNVVLVDKEGSLDTFALQAVPLEDSFCQFAMKDGFFITTKSGSDARLQGAAYAGVVGSYVGVPIPAGDAGLYGTLCHFDFADHPIDEQEFYLLERVAQLLSGHAALI